jgi:hypothetical protein
MRRSWTHTIEEQLLAIKGMKHNNPLAVRSWCCGGGEVRGRLIPQPPQAFPIPNSWHASPTHILSIQTFSTTIRRSKGKKTKVGSAFFSVLICVGVWGGSGPVPFDTPPLPHPLTQGDSCTLLILKNNMIYLTIEIALFLIYCVSHYKTLAFMPVIWKPKFETFRLVSLLKRTLMFKKAVRKLFEC